MTLTEFLLARIAEREAVARAAAHAEAADRWVVGHDGERVTDPGGVNVVPSAHEDVCRHIALNDPAYVLAECEAKWRIVEEHNEREVASLDRETWGQPFLVCRRCCEGGRQVVAPCPTLRFLALPDADHPDYREEWKP